MLTVTWLSISASWVRIVIFIICEQSLFGDTIFSRNISGRGECKVIWTNVHDRNGISNLAVERKRRKRKRQTERKKEREGYRRYVELTRANISWALYWKPIFMTLRSRVLAILFSRLPSTLIRFLRSFRPRIRICTISVSSGYGFAYHLSLSFDHRMFTGTF